MWKFTAKEALGFSYVGVFGLNLIFGGGLYSIVACLSRMAIDFPSPLRDGGERGGKVILGFPVHGSDVTVLTWLLGPILYAC